MYVIYHIPFFFNWKEVAEPLLDLKEGIDQLENNKTLGFILSTLLAIGNFLNGTNVSHIPSLVSPLSQHPCPAPAGGGCTSDPPKHQRTNNFWSFLLKNLGIFSLNYQGLLIWTCVLL